MKYGWLILLALAVSCEDDVVYVPMGAIGTGGSISVPGGGVPECSVDADCTNQVCADGVCVDPTPTFDFNPSAGSGVPNLTTKAGFTTTVLCDARTATTTNFPCTTGGTWTEADGDVTVGYATPFTEELARSADYDRFYSHEAPNTTLGEIASGVEFSLLVVAFVTDRGALQQIAGKYDTATSQGTGIWIEADGDVIGRFNATTLGDFQLDTLGSWNIFEIRRDNDVCGLYVNGVLSGSTGACSGTLATVTNAKNMAIGCRSNGTNNDCIDGKVAYTRQQTATAAGLTQATVAAENAARLMGVWPAQAVTDAPLTTDVRATVAMIDMDRDCDGVVRYFRVGAYWLRVTRRKAESTGGVCKIGYLPEPGVINKALQASVLGTTWTQVTVGDSVTANIFNSPLAQTGTSDADMDRLVAGADVVGLEHGVRQAITLTAAVHIISAVVAYDVGAAHKQFVALRDNTIGATAIGYFDVKACRPLTQGAGLHYDSNGFGPYAAARVQDLGTVSAIKFCRVSVHVMGTAAAHDIDVLAANADGDTTFTTSAAQALIGLGLVQVEAADDGYGATTFLPTLTATSTRNLDGLSYNIDSFPTSGTLVSEVLFRNSFMQNGSTGNVAAYICTPYKDANNYILLKSTASTGQGVRSAACVSASGGVYTGVLVAGADQMEACAQGSSLGQWYAPATNLHDGQPHRMRLRYAAADFRTYVDGDQTAGSESFTGTVPTLTGGSILIGYESATGTNQSAGLVSRCRMFDVEFEPEFP